MDSFNKAMSARSGGSRLSRLFSGSKMMPPSPAAQASPTPHMLSLDDMLLSQPVGSRCSACFHVLLFGLTYNQANILHYHNSDTLVLQDVIPTSLLRLGADNSARAVKMFGGVQKYIGTGEAGGEPLSDEMLVEVAAKLMHQAIKRPELRDELYMQVNCLNWALTCEWAMPRKEAVNRQLHAILDVCQTAGTCTESALALP